ncbi:hypothetical protein F5Y11DRAFT_317423 [Daldinia sp. FL1419]|nr:hypothetical protein F5Y11DRAFT_317423 [Daldinia sp. FL1419]
MSSPAFTNLIRFLDESSTERYGDIPNGSLDNIVGLKVSILEGDIFSLRRTENTAVVHKLLSPVPSTPLFICIGLNYADHAKESNLAIPPNPVIFTKPSDALTGPYSDVPVPPEAELMDYEGELCVIISKTGKNIPEEKALDYVLGVTAGNDLSSRKWQRPPYSGGQFTYAKSFDHFAPIGPTILHGSLVASRSPFTIKTTVNGEVRQNGNTSDMLFSIEKVIAHASRGTTLRQGTIIMTGTPAGIAAKWPGEPWLKDGDVVEVDISGVGSLKNKLVFGKES